LGEGRSWIMRATWEHSRRLTWLYALALVFCLQTAAFAAKVPPSIDDIQGVYDVKTKWTWYDLTDGSASKGSHTYTWAITKTSATTIEVDVDGWVFQAYYVNGIMVHANGDPLSNPSTEMGLGHVVFSGTAGKVKMKGLSGYETLSSGCEFHTWSGKMVLSGPPPMPLPSSIAHGRSPENADDVEDPDDPDLEEADETLQGAALPPGIDDLVGTYAAKISGTMYQPSTGSSEKGKETDTWEITKEDDTTLNLHSLGDGTDIKAYYVDGALMVAEVEDDSDICSDAMFAILVVKGKPGKVKMKGTALSVMDLFGVDDEFEVAKVSVKQVTP
jgi:hypothetical protein